jgi:hypothetical protein
MALRGAQAQGAAALLPPPVCRARRRAPRLAAAAADGAPGSAGAAGGASADAADAPLRVTLRTAEARGTLRFAESRQRAACHVIVSAVGTDSEAQRAGVRPGDRVLSMSDPVRPSVLWTLNDKASVRFVRDALRLRVAADVTLVLQHASEAEVLALLLASEGGAPAQPQLAQPQEQQPQPPAEEEAAGPTVAEALEAAWARKQDAATLPTASQRCVVASRLRCDARLGRARVSAMQLTSLTPCDRDAADAPRSGRRIWRRLASATTRPSSRRPLRRCCRPH